MHSGEPVVVSGCFSMFAMWVYNTYDKMYCIRVSVLLENKNNERNDPNMDLIQVYFRTQIFFFPLRSVNIRCVTVK